MGMDYFVVGIDGSKTPDPRYWADRWLVIEDIGEKEAIGQYIEKKKHWLHPSEKSCVNILFAGMEKADCENWIRKNYPWKKEI